MLHLLPILARSDDDDWMKIVFGIIVAAIWGLGSLISSWNKKAEAERKRRQQIALSASRQTSYPNPTQHQYSAPQRSYAPSPPAKQAKQRQPKRRRQVVPVQPPPPVPAAAPPVPSTMAQVDQAPKPAAQALPEAARVARLIHRKDSLRAALILSEVLAPPVSLRE